LLKTKFPQHFLVVYHPRVKTLFFNSQHWKEDQSKRLKEQEQRRFRALQELQPAEERDEEGDGAPTGRKAAAGEGAGGPGAGADR
jgi:hypothetical protein